MYTICLRKLTPKIYAYIWLSPDKSTNMNISHKLFIAFTTQILAMKHALWDCLDQNHLFVIPCYLLTIQ